MLTQEQTVEIRVLARQGHSIRHIARTLGVSRNTVRRYLRDPSVARYQPR
ncbi:helix-turn-helix domain-containing protein, partial [Klebsiella variicola]|nr:helix-turn-helix domain-containing protein [Citrobacter freundii]HCK0554918.1 helix-turn-helix domain-containing protein [Pseudomonas aeruginosa]